MELGLNRAAVLQTLGAPIVAQETQGGAVDTVLVEGRRMRWLLCFFLVGCGGTSVDCEAGEHRSGDGCAPDRVFDQADSGGGSDTAES